MEIVNEPPRFLCRLAILTMLPFVLIGCPENPADRLHYHSEILIDDGISPIPYQEHKRRY